MSTNEARTLGTVAYHKGQARIMPLADFLKEDGSMDKTGARAWYSGWDSANLSDPS